MISMYPSSLLRGLLAVGFVVTVATHSLAGAAANKAAPPATKFTARKLLDAVAYGPSGSLVEELVARNARPTLDAARSRNIPDDVIGEIERVFRDFFEKIVEETVVPIYTETFNEQELNELIAFFNSAPGRKYRDQLSSREITVEKALSKTGAQRPAIETFFRTPTGQHYLKTASAINKRIDEEMFRKSTARSNELARQIQQLRTRYRF